MIIPPTPPSAWWVDTLWLSAAVVLISVCSRTIVNFTIDLFAPED